MWVVRWEWEWEGLERVGGLGVGFGCVVFGWEWAWKWEGLEDGPDGLAMGLDAWCSAGRESGGDWGWPGGLGVGGVDVRRLDWEGWRMGGRAGGSCSFLKLCALSYLAGGNSYI